MSGERVGQVSAEVSSACALPASLAPVALSAWLERLARSALWAAVARCGNEEPSDEMQVFRRALA